MSDLTRWNRAGLARFDYVDGNAAVFLERMRAGLQERFPQWRTVQATFPRDGAGRSLESEEARKRRLEDLYAASPDDMLWQITRQFARACHVLGGHLDAYANEACLGTASQWENLRRLVELLDYAPRPPASAATPLALFLKPGAAGSIAAGLQLRYSPAKGAPLVFESLAALAADHRLNTLHARDHRRNPDALGGTTIELEGRLDKLKAGEPLVLEDESTPQGRLSAHRVEGLILGDERTTVTIAPPVPSGFAKGRCRVHILPRERLKLLGPATSGVDEVGHSLQLAVSPAGLAVGDLVTIRSADDKPLYRRIKAVHDDRLVFYRRIGQLTLAGATVARPVVVPISHLNSPPGSRRIGEMEVGEDTVVDVVYVAGDWSRLAGEWLADIRRIDGREYLPSYRCLHAKYVPVTTDSAWVEVDERPGYTALTLTWHPDTDGVAGGHDLRLKNPQTLLAPPPTPGPWPVDRFLNKSQAGRLASDLLCEAGKQTAAGDLAVVLRGAQMAWARLATVAVDAEHGEATLSADGGWQDRGGGPYFLSTSRMFSHFGSEARVLGWQDNRTPLAGTRVDLEAVDGGDPLWPAVVKAGRRVIVDNGSATPVQTRLRDFGIAAGGAWLELADPLPPGSTAGKLRIHANVTEIGHGESRPPRVLGSGDGTLSNQSFVLPVGNLSFVADAEMGAGVRADLDLQVDGETWKQVTSLKDSAPSDAHYQVRIDEDGQARIQFGDGRHGRRLPSGSSNLRAAFRQGSGAAGNLPPGLLSRLARPHPLIDSVAQLLPSGGGADRENNADLRRNAPATLLTLDRAVSLADFAQLARSNASVWQARAFRLPPGLGQRERIEVVVMAAGGDALLPELRDKLAAFLAVRAQPGVAVSVVDHTGLSFRVEVRIRVRTAAYDGRSVGAAVVAALEAEFSARVRELGQPLYRGEVYRVVDAVTGVENSQCRILPGAIPAAVLAREKPPLEIRVDGELQALKPGPRQCLSLDSSGLVIAVADYEETLL